MSNPSTGGVDPGAEPSGAATGTGEARNTGTDRSFQPTGGREPGHVPPDQEGGGTMSGRGSERGESWREQGDDAHGAISAGDAAERSADVGGSAGADLPDDLSPRGPNGSGRG